MRVPFNTLAVGARFRLNGDDVWVKRSTRTGYLSWCKRTYYFKWLETVTPLGD